MVDFEDRVLEPQRLLALDEALKDALARWWEKHNKSINGLSLCRRLMEVFLGETEQYQVERYYG